MIIRMRKQKIQASDFAPVLWRWLLILGGVWVLLAIVYGVLAIKTQQREQRLLKQGVTLVQSFTANAGLPLLEQDVKTLHHLLTEIGKQPQVLYASVVDHRNKIIAYTDAGQFFPERSKKTNKIEGIESWQDNDAMIFAGPINFSQVPIGEIRLALSLSSITELKKIFGIIVFIAVAAMVILPIGLYFRQLIQWASELGYKRKQDGRIQLMVCPLCGQDADHGAAFCRGLDMDRTPVFRFPSLTAGMDGALKLRLSDIGTDPDLALVKERLIRQCAEIIRKLAINDNCPG